MVAEEIRTLAETTHHSATEIEHLIKGIQTDTHSTIDQIKSVHQQVDGGLSIMSTVKSAFHSITISMNGTMPIIDRVTISSEEMYKHIKLLSETFNTLLLFSKQNAELSEEISAASEEQLASFEEVSASAIKLAETADQLKKLISQFHY